MATSGSIDFTANRDDIITEALEQMGVLAEGQAPSPDQLTSMSRTLNMLVKAWQAEGMNLFTIQKLYVYLEKNKNEYSLGSSTSDHISTEYNRTTTSATSVSGASTITVYSITDMGSADYIGIKQSDGTMHWTTINGAPAGSTVTLTDVTTASINSGVTVYFYTSKANRPMKISNVVISDSISNQDIPIWMISRQEYIELPNKISDGIVNSIYYDPQINLGKLFVWPESDTVDKYLTIWVQRTLEDFDAASDDADFPQEWFLPLAMNLAVISCTKYGVHRTQRSHIANVAHGLKTMAESFDREDGFQFQPEFTR